MESQTFIYDNKPGWNAPKQYNHYSDDDDDGGNKTSIPHHTTPQCSLCSCFEYFTIVHHWIIYAIGAQESPEAIGKHHFGMNKSWIKIMAYNIFKWKCLNLTMVWRVVFLIFNRFYLFHSFFHRRSFKSIQCVCTNILNKQWNCTFDGTLASCWTLHVSKTMFTW